MTDEKFKQAIKKLKENYEIAIKSKAIIGKPTKPLEWALYQTWQDFDKMLNEEEVLNGENWTD